MNRSFRSRALRGAVACMLTVVGLSCTESDEQLVEDIGVTRLYPVDPGILHQSVVFPQDRIQVAEWKIAEAVLDIDGSLVELVSPADGCWVTDTVMVSPQIEGACASGIVVESSNAPFQIQLVLEIESMQVRRGLPLDLSETVDFDGDGVVNDADGSGSSFDAPCGLGGVTFDCDDNCPLIANADQADDNGDGVGNACTVFDPFQGALRDSDADGVPDSVDNCVAVFNPDQADSSGRTGIPPEPPENPEDPEPDDPSFPDGIGDACVEQVAPVTWGGNSSFTLLLGPALLSQSIDSNTYLTVDFDNREALDCQWDALTCELDPSKVEFCAHPNILQALAGC